MFPRKLVDTKYPFAVLGKHPRQLATCRVRNREGGVSMPKRLSSFWMMLCLCFVLTGCDKDEENLGPTADTMSPGAVSTLSVGSPTYGTLMLWWTAPGDLGCGRASKYDIRWAQTSVTDRNWVMCIKVDGEPTPGVPGARDSVLVHLPYDGTQYYFGLVSVDCVGNESKISNSPSGRTNERPNNVAPIQSTN